MAQGLPLLFMKPVLYLMLITNCRTLRARQMHHHGISLPSKLQHSSIFASILCHIHLSTRRTLTHRQKTMKQSLYSKKEIIRFFSSLACPSTPYIESSPLSIPSLAQIFQLIIPPSVMEKCYSPAVKLRLNSDSNQPIHIEVTIKWVVLPSGVHTRVTFGAANNIVDSNLLGTSYIDLFMAGIFLLERWIVPVQSPPVANLASYSYDEAT